MLLLSLLVVPALFRLSAAGETFRDTAPFRCPFTDIVSTQCRGEKDCVYPNPGSCNTYIQCSANSDFVSGTPAVKNCMPRHEWNDKDKKCDVPEKSTCPVYANAEKKIRNADSPDKFGCTGLGCPSPVVDGIASGVEDVLLKGAPNRRNVGDVPDFKCPPEDIIRTKCAAHTDCVYAYPSYCNEYIQCNVDAGGKTGTPVVVHCPRDFEWNDKIKECDDRSRSTCVGETLEEAIGNAGNGLEEAVIQFLPGSEKRRAGRRSRVMRGL